MQNKLDDVEKGHLQSTEKKLYDRPLSQFESDKLMMQCIPMEGVLAVESSQRFPCPGLAIRFRMFQIALLTRSDLHTIVAMRHPFFSRDTWKIKQPLIDVTSGIVQLILVYKPSHRLTM